MRWPFVRRTEHDRVFAWYLEAIHSKASAEMVLLDVRKEYTDRIVELEDKVARVWYAGVEIDGIPVLVEVEPGDEAGLSQKLQDKLKLLGEIAGAPEVYEVRKMSP